MVTIPSIDNLHVKKLIERLSLKSKPLLIPYATEDFAKVNYCYQNVEEKIQLDGGHMVLGWQVWNHSFMIEAESHAIWKSKKGQLFDISPKSIDSEFHLVSRR